MKVRLMLSAWEKRGWVQRSLPAARSWKRPGRPGVLWQTARVPTFEDHFQPPSAAVPLSPGADLQRSYALRVLGTFSWGQPLDLPAVLRAAEVARPTAVAHLAKLEAAGYVAPGGKAPVKRRGPKGKVYTLTSKGRIAQLHALWLEAGCPVGAPSDDLELEEAPLGRAQELHRALTQHEPDADFDDPAKRL